MKTDKVEEPSREPIRVDYEGWEWMGMSDFLRLFPGQNPEDQGFELMGGALRRKKAK